MAGQVLFLCTGNSCRSPLAEVMAAARPDASSGRFGSCGLEARPGQPASPESVAEAARRGLDLAGHRSRAVTPDLLDGTDWVIGMTRSHAAIFRARCGGSFAGRIGVLGAPGVDLSGGGPSPAAEDVDDPYGGGPDRYAVAAEQIERLVQAWDDVFRNLEGTNP